VINTGGPVAELALLYSRMAREDGADALMLRPPTFQPAGPDQIIAYYQMISDTVALPIFIQDTPSTPVSGSLARQIGDSSEHVRYVKVESGPPPYKVAQAVDSVGDRMTVFGGAGGSFFVEEMRRGSSGTMPGCSQPEDFVAVWDAYQAGDETTAQSILYERILPVNRLATQSPGAFYHVHKEILRRRGVIRTANVRGPVQPLDRATQQEIGPVLDALDAQADARRPT